MVLRAVNEDLLTVIPEATAEVSVLRNSMPGALKQSSSCPSAALEGSACELHTCISLPESYSETILIRMWVSTVSFLNFPTLNTLCLMNISEMNGSLWF